MVFEQGKKDDWPRILGKAILLASVQVAYGGVEMSSKFSVLNFSKDEKTLQNAANALTSYIIIGTFWTIGCVLIMCATYGKRGVIAAVACNGLIMLWIVTSYLTAFREASKTYNIPMPKLFKSIV